MQTTETDMIKSEAALESALATPDAELVSLFRRLDGDLIILGANGKMGLSLGALAVRAREAAGGDQRIYAVSRFSEAGAVERARALGMIPMRCDLLDRSAIAQLPAVPNVLYLAGRKFGTIGSEPQTWASNVLIPAAVGEHFPHSRVVVFSTGCVYPLMPSTSTGCDESTPPAPVGEYAQSCMGRERIFEYFCDSAKTAVCLYRLNYSVDLRYGALFDIATKIWHGQPVDISVSTFNVVWQGDANRYALHALELASTPAARLNVTGPERLQTRQVAETFGTLMNKPVTFTGTAGSLNYLSDASECHRRFGAPHISADTLIRLQAEWIMRGLPTLDRPTHFEVTSGAY